MEQTEYKFKTNLNCGGCVSKVKTDLDISLQQEKEGLLTPHTEVMKKYRKWHTK